MLWKRGDRPGDVGAQFRRVHEAWLDRALRTGAPDLRIPTRRVREGGFDRLMSRSTGRHWAQTWWMKAMERVDI